MKEKKRLTRAEKNILFAASFIKGSKKIIERWEKELKDGTYEEMIDLLIKVVEAAFEQEGSEFLIHIKQEEIDKLHGLIEKYKEDK